MSSEENASRALSELHSYLINKKIAFYNLYDIINKKKELYKDDIEILEKDETIKKMEKGLESIRKEIEDIVTNKYFIHAEQLPFAEELRISSNFDVSDIIGERFEMESENESHSSHNSSCRNNKLPKKHVSQILIKKF